MYRLWKHKVHNLLVNHFFQTTLRYTESFETWYLYKVRLTLRPLNADFQMSRSMTSPTNYLCAQRKQMSLAICPVWSVFIVGLRKRCGSKLFSQFALRRQNRLSWCPARSTFTLCAQICSYFHAPVQSNVHIIWQRMLINLLFQTLDAVFPKDPLYRLFRDHNGCRCDVRWPWNISLYIDIVVLVLHFLVLLFDSWVSLNPGLSGVLP